MREPAAGAAWPMETQTVSLREVQLPPPPTESPSYRGGAWTSSGARMRRFSSPHRNTNAEEQFKFTEIFERPLSPRSPARQRCKTQMLPTGAKSMHRVKTWLTGWFHSPPPNPPCTASGEPQNKTPYSSGVSGEEVREHRRWATLWTLIRMTDPPLSHQTSVNLSAANPLHLPADYPTPPTTVTNPGNHQAAQYEPRDYIADLICTQTQVAHMRGALILAARKPHQEIVTEPTFACRPVRGLVP